MRNKPALLCSIKICALGFDKLKKHFLSPAGCGSIFPAKSFEMLEEVRCSQLLRGQVNVLDEAKLHSPICSTFEVLVVWCWALSVDQSRLQALQFLVHLVDLMSILLRYNGLARIQKAVVDQMGSRPPVTMTFFLVQVWIWEVLWSFFSVQPLIWSLLVVI